MWIVTMRIGGLYTFLVLLFFHQTHRSLAVSFTPLMTANGLPLCANGNFSYSIQTDDIIGVPHAVPGATKCGFFCTGLNSRSTCTGFNYITSGLCQFFNDPCITSSSTPGCMYYQHSGINQALTCNHQAACRSDTLFITVDNVLLNVFVNGNEVRFDTNHANVWSKAKLIPLPCPTSTIGVHGKNVDSKAGILVWASRETIQSNSQWKCVTSPGTANGWASNTFNDSAWQAAVELSPYSQGPWGDGVSNSNGPAPMSSSKWIWSSAEGNTDGQEIFCRFTLT